jgi:spermidine/putrescine transport system permease protein
MKYRSRFPKYVTIAVLLFFYIPLIIMTINSFNASRFGVVWNGFTFKWYIRLFHDSEILTAFLRSLIIGTGSMCVSMILGTIAAFCIYNYRSKVQIFQQVLIYAQLGIPDILIGISMLMFFIAVNIKLGLITIFIAHVTFCVGYVTLVVLGRFQDFDYSVIEAAKDLGAGWHTIFLKIIIPFLSPGIIAGGLLAFTLSIDDFVITFFVTGVGTTTLPVYIYSMIKHGTPIIINALSVIFFLVTFVIVLISQKILNKKVLLK